MGQWTYMIFSAGRAEVTAEMTSVRQLLTFSVMPSLSIMIICSGRVSVEPGAGWQINRTYVCSCVEEGLCAVDEPLRVPSSGGLELLNGCVAASTPPEGSVQCRDEQEKALERCLLDADLRLGLEAVCRGELDERGPVVSRDGQEARRDLQHVEAKMPVRCCSLQKIGGSAPQVLARCQVLGYHGLVSTGYREDTLDESSGAHVAAWGNMSRSPA